MKKISTTYSVTNLSRARSFEITVSEDVGFKHVSVHDGGEPCSGILRHWGSPKDLISELEEVIEALKEI